MNMRVIGIVVAGVVLVSCVTIWAMRGRNEDPKVQEVVEKVRTELDTKSIPPEKRREKWEELRKDMEPLSDVQKQAVFEGMRKEWEKREDQRMTAYFAMSAPQRVAELDQRIDEMARMRKEWESWAKQAGKLPPGGQSGPGGGGQVGGPAPSPGGPGPGGPPPGGPGPGKGDWKNATPEQRAQWRKTFLDRSTPEQRAQRAVYFEDLRKRMAERGIQPPSFGPGGPGPR